MIELRQALAGHELIVLKVIGEWWELDLTSSDQAGAIDALIERLSAINLTEEMVYLEEEESNALKTLAENGGGMLMAGFSRRFGEIRTMGEAKMEREQPWFDPASAAESLWYRGLIYRIFEEQGAEVSEIVVLPKELLEQIAPAKQTPTKKKATPKKQKKIQDKPTKPAVSAPDDFVETVTDAADDVTTLLAFAQAGQSLEAEQVLSFMQDKQADRLGLLLSILTQFLKMGDKSGKPSKASVAWLQASVDEQLIRLAEGWMTCAWESLPRVPSLICEQVAHEPSKARAVLKDNFAPTTEWVKTIDLIEQIKQNDPDFQRPNGDYEGWYVRSNAAETTDYLRGFSSWDQVEGRQLQYIIENPMHWLGLTEFGEDVFRLTERGVAWVTGEEIKVEKPTVLPIIIQPTATIIVPQQADRFARFQLSRVADLQSMELGRPYVYQLSPASLTRAKESGIGAERVIAFLEKLAGKGLPQSVRRGIERWGQKGKEGYLAEMVVLRVSSPQILETLLKNEKTKPYLGEPLGETAIALRKDDLQEFQKICAQLGLLLDR